MSLFDHAVNMTHLYMKTNDAQIDVPAFLEQTFAILEIWRAATPLSEQQSTIEAYNSNPISPYISMWMFDHEKEYGWDNTFPTLAAHNCLNVQRMILKEYVPVILQRIEQAVEENDRDFFAQAPEKGLCKMFRRMIVGFETEDVQTRTLEVLQYVRRAHLNLFNSILLSLPKDYVQKHCVELEAEEFLANLYVLEFFTSADRGLERIDQWMTHLNYAKDHIRTLSPETCRAIRRCWMGRDSRQLSDDDNLKIVSILAQRFPTQFDAIFPLFFDLEQEINAPKWQVQAALMYFPEQLPNVAGVLAERLFADAVQEGEIKKQWHHTMNFYEIPGVRECVLAHPLPIELRYTIYNVSRWQKNIQRALTENLDFPHPGLKEVSSLLLDFAGGDSANYPKHVVFHNETESSNPRLQEFEQLLQKRKLQHELQDLTPQVTKVKKM